MEISGCLYTLLSHNVGGDRQLRPRWIGFRGELDLLEKLRSRSDIDRLLSGGVFIPTQHRAKSFDNPIYFTVIRSTESMDDYLQIYSKVAKIGCRTLYLIVYDDKVPFSKWEKQDIMRCGVKLPAPSMTVFKFENGDAFEKCPDGLNALYREYRPSRRSGVKTSVGFCDFDLKNIFCTYDDADLLDLYTERLIFDGLLGYGVYKGVPTDIDCIILANDGKIFLIEVKEKDLSKRPPIGFGMDIRRRDGLLTLQQKTAYPVWYIVREVNNQKERNFVQWRVIKLDRYIQATTGLSEIEGGTGMRHFSSSNPTSVCPVKYFTSL